MWLFDKLKAIGKAIIIAITNPFSFLNFFGKKKTPVVPIENPKPKSIEPTVIPRKIRHIPHTPKPPTEEEISACMAIKPNQYNHLFKYQPWAKPIYEAYRKGDIRTDQLKDEIDSQRMLYKSLILSMLP